MTTPDPDRGRAVRGIAAAWVLSFLVWLAASGSLEPASVVTGLVLTGLVAAATVSRTGFWTGLDLRPARLLALLSYLALFSKEIVKSNIAMLGFVYAPRLRLAPAVTVVPIRLVGPRERLVLTSTISLTPGSLTIDLNGPEFRVHMLDEGMEAGTRSGIARFEDVLERAVG